MNESDIEIVEINKCKQVLIEGKNYCDESYLSGKRLYVYDDELFERLVKFEVRHLLRLFERIHITYDLIDDVWLDVEINPDSFYFEENEGKLRISAVMRYNIEDWNKSWSIKQHSALFFEKILMINGAEIRCEIGERDEITGKPIYDLFNGFGLGIAIDDQSVQLFDIYRKAFELCSSVNTEVKNELSSEVGFVIERSIEFPPEYHQAGIGILSYFGSYLREQYSEESAAVKIEQDGLNVRMVIETECGNSETIEKALHEYELIVTGKESPEKYAKNEKLAFELRNELRIAQFRLESQQDLIGMQSSRIDQLLNIVGTGLSQKHHVAIDFKPEITLSSSVSINQNIAAALGHINELVEGIPQTNDAYLALNELKKSLTTIEADNDPASVRRSPAMSKFKRLIDNVVESSGGLNTAIKQAESGWEIFTELAGKYNKAAEWCGLPVIPSALIK